MNQVHYQDKKIAICDYDETFLRHEEAISSLLTLDYKAPSYENNILPLLHCLNCVVTVRTMAPMTDEMRQLLEEYKIPFVPDSDMNGIMLPAIRLGNPQITRVVVSIPSTIRRIKRQAEYLQFLAKLYALSQGNRNFENLLSDLKTNDYFLECKLDLPAMAINDLRLFDDKKNRVTFNTVNKSARRYEASFFFGYYLDIRADRVSANEMINLKNWVKTTGSFNAKEIIAAYMLEAFINAACSLPYRVDVHTLKLQKNEDNDLLASFVRLLTEGRVSACPYCGKLFLKKHASNTPFCKNSHATNYINKAKYRIQKQHKSVSEVCAEFPAINPETIKNWLA